MNNNDIDEDIEKAQYLLEGKCPRCGGKFVECTVLLDLCVPLVTTPESFKYTTTLGTPTLCSTCHSIPNSVFRQLFDEFLANRPDSHRPKT